MAIHLNDQLAVLLGTKNRDAFWTQTALEFPAFSDNIKHLSERMRIVGESKKLQPSLTTNIALKPFMGVEDEMAREFLGDVLISRMTDPRGYMSYHGRNPAVEVKAMEKEMGLQDGWRSEQAKGVTLEKTVSSVLQGKLRVVH